MKAILIILGRFGAMNEIIWQTDRGSNFIAGITEKLLKVCRIEHSKGVASSHQDQSLVENRNRQVNNSIRAILYDIGDAYGNIELYLPLVQRVLNSLPIKTTGFSPAEIMTPGLDLETNPYQMNFKRNEEKRNGDWIEKLYKVQYQILDQVRTFWTV